MGQEHSVSQLWDDMALTRLSRSLKLSIGPTKVILAFLAVLLISTAGFVMDLCTRSVVVNPSRVVPRGLIGSSPASMTQGTELAVYLQIPKQTKAFIERYQGQTKGQGVFATLWDLWAGRFNDTTVRLFKSLFQFYSSGESNQSSETVLYYVISNVLVCLRSLMWAIQFHTLYSIVFFSFSFLVMCAAGGAICRCAALEFARNEKPGLFEAFQFAGEKFLNLVGAPLIPMVFLGLFTLMLMVIGLLANIPWAGELLVALLLAGILLIGLLLTLLLFASSAGVGLMFPAIAYEGTTGLDAIGRSISYVFNKPLWMAYYVLVQTALGTFFYVVLRWLIFAALWITYHSIRLGIYRQEGMPSKLDRIWAEPTLFYLLAAPGQSAGWSESVAAYIISFILLGIVAVMMSCMLTFAFSSMTIIYALLRKKADKLPIDQIWVKLDGLHCRPVKSEQTT